MAQHSISGTLTALVTPFTDGDEIDFGALDALVEAQIQGGVTGLVPCGTTGETPTLTDDEQRAVIARTARAAKGRAAVYAGTGSFSTKKTIAASKAALEAGADGVMIVMPYYSKPSQDGLVEHTVTVAESVGAPVVLYNIPGRSAVDLSVEATARICERAPNVVAIKDATGNVLRCQELRRRLGERLTVLSGDDALTVAMMAAGARGVISVASNVRPRHTSEVTRRMLAGDLEGALAAQLALLPLYGLLFAEPNPAPAKAALAQEGKMRAAVRLPLVGASATLGDRLASALAALDRELPLEAPGSAGSR